MGICGRTQQLYIKWSNNLQICRAALLLVPLWGARLMLHPRHILRSGH